MRRAINLGVSIYFTVDLVNMLNISILYILRVDRGNGPKYSDYALGFNAKISHVDCGNAKWCMVVDEMNTVTAVFQCGKLFLD